MQKIIKFVTDTVKETDILLMFLCLSASLFGIIMVHSATSLSIEEGALLSRDARTMLLAVCVGAVFAVIISFIDYQFITKMFPLIGAVCILMMLVLFIPGVGVGPAERPDAKTWISLGSTGLFFQPSELVKIGFIITFGMHIDLVQDKLKSIFHLLLLCIHGLVPAGLVIVSGDLGSALVFLIIFITMMFCAGVQMRYFILGIAGICAMIPGIWYVFFSETQKERFLGLLFPERYSDIMYQQNKGLEAIASGGFSGQGLFNGKYTQNEIVPESENDMIFTCIGEELGFIGCFLAIAILLAIIIKIVFIGIKSKENATAMMCYGTAAMFASQVIINLGMCLKIFPVIGITLPFFSAGGSSNLCIYIGIGLIMSIYRFNKEKEVENLRFGRLN
ncbi:MAG: FtsW/RodA/SpoVE family cell cycle protein [Clostridia bacterium]|nr:FtsW/RodA/SpoVE family cell cycle protein [Clostridia bacterium]